MQKTIHFNGATITVQRGTVRSRLRTSALYSKLGVSEQTSDEDMLGYTYYLRLLTQCAVEGHLPFDLPATSADVDTLRAGYEAFMESDEALFDALVNAFNDTDEEYQPEELRPDAKKN